MNLASLFDPLFSIVKTALHTMPREEFDRFMEADLAGIVVIECGTVEPIIRLDRNAEGSPVFTVLIPRGSALVEDTEKNERGNCFIRDRNGEVKGELAIITGGEEEFNERVKAIVDAVPEDCKASAVNMSFQAESVSLNKNKMH